MNIKVEKQRSFVKTSDKLNFDKKNNGGPHLPRQNLLFHGKTYFSTEKLLLTAKLTFWWRSDEKDVDQFIEQANKFHPTIKFTAEISENEITFLDTVMFKGERLKKRIHFEDQNSLQTLRDSGNPP